MLSELLWALLLFVVVTLFTPGPNNTMLMTSGLNFGFRRGLPHLWGVALGFAVMVLAVGLGLGAVFQAYPAAYTVLKYAGAAYLLYLAWQIATAGELEGGSGERAADHFPGGRGLPVAQPEGLGDGGRRGVDLRRRRRVSVNMLLMAASVRQPRHPVERDVARLRHGAEAAADQPARGAGREHHHGAAAGGVAVADPGGGVEVAWHSV